MSEEHVRRGHETEPSQGSSSHGTLSPEGLLVTIEAAIPPDIVARVLAIGAVEWGSVKAKPDAEHAADFADSLRITREHFGLEGNRELHGAYLEGTETVLCHTGISPNSSDNARIIVGLWNALHSTLTGLPNNAPRDVSDGQGDPKTSTASEASDNQTIPEPR